MESSRLLGLMRAVTSLLMAPFMRAPGPTRGYSDTRRAHAASVRAGRQTVKRGLRAASAAREREELAKVAFCTHCSTWFPSWQQRTAHRDAYREMLRAQRITSEAA